MFRLENQNIGCSKKAFPRKFVMQSWTLAMPCRHNRAIVFEGLKPAMRTLLFLGLNLILGLRACVITISTSLIAELAGT